MVQRRWVVLAAKTRRCCCLIGGVGVRGAKFRLAPFDRDQTEHPENPQGLPVGAQLCPYPGREADFLVTIDSRSWFAVAAKQSAPSIEPSPTHLWDHLRMPWAHQVVLEGKRDFVQHAIRCVPARQVLGGL